jgi:predicted nuclease of predicted toxin-antitoxin system
MTVIQVITNLYLDEIEQRGELADDNGHVVMPYDADFVVETILTRGDPPLLPE